jgi:signal transduction histidine kinase
MFTSIRARLLATYVLTVLGIMLVSGYLVYEFRDFYVNRSREELRAWGVMLARSVRDPLANGEMQRVRELVAAFEAGQQYAFEGSPGPQRAQRALQVYDARGRLIASAGAPRPTPEAGALPAGVEDVLASGRIIEARERDLRPGSEYIYEVVPVRGAGETLGVVRMALFQADVERSMVRIGALAAIAAAAALCAFINLIVARGVAQPVRLMNRFAEAIGKGRFGEQLPIRSGDEVGSLAVQLNRMSHQLAHGEQERREFLAAVSHELRTPVSNVQVTLESLIAGAAEEAGTRDRFLAAALGETHRLADLIRDLIDLARLEAGEMSMRYREVRLFEVLDRLQSAVEPRLRERGLTIEASVPSDLHVWADPDRLLQVLMILVDNAVKFAPAESAIEVFGAAARHEVHLAVRDYGPGLREEDLPHVFDRFYTGDKSRARGPAGTGLGLAIAKRIVDAHSGAIEAGNAGGSGGAEFRISLPR